MINSARQRVLDLEKLAEESQFLEKPTSVWRNALRRLLRRKIAIAGLIIIGFWVLVAIFAPLIATHDPNRGLLGQPGVTRRDSSLYPRLWLFGRDSPSTFLGLDGNARDEFSRIVYGTRISLTIGLTTVTVAVLVGAAPRGDGRLLGRLDRQR